MQATLLRDGLDGCCTNSLQADPKQASKKDDDGRLPIHWAASSNKPDIVLLLAQQKGFDPDVEVSMGRVPASTTSSTGANWKCFHQDESGWTPLMIAASVKDSEKLVELLLQRGADVNQTSRPLQLTPDSGRELAGPDTYNLKITMAK
jgi:26S proteasome non-ATPase regulatory subunit 10